VSERQMSNNDLIMAIEYLYSLHCNGAFLERVLREALTL
jgi:hypothetical protein